MTESYFGFVLAAYGVAALAIGGLSAFVLFDGRRTNRELEKLEATLGRRGREPRR